MSNWARAGRELGSLRPQTGLSPGVATKRTDRGRAAVIRRQARLRGTQPAAAAWDGGKASVSRLPRRGSERGGSERGESREEKRKTGKAVSGESREKESARQAGQ